MIGRPALDRGCLSGVGQEILGGGRGGGESGIRTHEAFQPAGFQDQCIRPLCHLSKPAGKLPLMLAVRTPKKLPLAWRGLF